MINFDENEEDFEMWMSVELNGKNYPDYVVSSKGKIYSMKTNKIVTGAISKGYNKIKLRDENNQLYQTGRHRIVAERYCEHPDGKDTVNHIDGNKLNNVPDNLEWVTPQENTIHAVEHGLIYTVGDKSHFASISEDTAREMCKLIVKGISLKEISKQLNVGYDCVKKINAGRSWKHISKEYGII